MTQSSFVPRPQLCQAVAFGIPLDRLETLQRHFEDYSAGYAKQIILDMSSVSEDRMDELEEALGFDPVNLGPGLVVLWAEQPQPLQSYAVLYRDPEQSVLDPPAMFRCQAEDCDHAEEQCLFANLDADVVWIIHVNDEEKTDIELIEQALKMNYAADTGGGRYVTAN